MPNFHLLPTRFNSLRLLDLDAPDVIKSYFVTMETYKFAPFFGDIRLAKQVVAALFAESDRREIELYSYVVMTDHIHFLAGAGLKDLERFVGLFKSYSTRLLWKRSREIAGGDEIARPLVTRPRVGNMALRKDVMERPYVVLPEHIYLDRFECPNRLDFANKYLWNRSFFDHICRNTEDFFNVVMYILENPVKRGYVSRPEFYPFSGSFLMRGPERGE